MIAPGEHIIESYAQIVNTDRSILKLNPLIEKFGYTFVCVDATELEKEFSELVNVPKSDKRKLTIIIGRHQHGISLELHKALIHTPVFGQRFMHMEYPEMILLKRIKNFKIDGEFQDFLNERVAFDEFYTFFIDLLLQLRLYKPGEIRCYQIFNITSVTRQISFRVPQIDIGSFGNYTINDNDVIILSTILKEKYEPNPLTELASKNFNIVYDIPDGRIRYITLMTCLESLFNLGKDQIAHTIARHLSIILSEDREQFKKNYTEIKKLYNMRNNIIHGSEYKGEDLMKDYLDLSEKVRKSIAYCNTPNLTKEKLFEELNVKGF